MTIPREPETDAATKASNPAPAQRSLIERIVREPLLHFVLVGVALFGLAEWRNPSPDSDGRQIVLTDGDIEQIRIAMLAQGSVDPGPEQMRNLIEAKVREEVLYREAIGMGLDQDDTIIRRRLAQKMDFLAEDLSALRDPTADELQAWLDEHPVDFTIPPRVSFRHLYFSPDVHGAGAREAAMDAQARLAALASDPEQLDALGDRFMFQDYYGDRTPAQVADVFGPEFAAAVFTLSTGSWSSPIESGLGWHLVMVDSQTPGRTPALDEVEDSVKLQWQENRRREFKAEAYKVMRDKYEVVLPASLGANKPAAAEDQVNPHD